MPVAGMLPPGQNPSPESAQYVPAMQFGRVKLASQLHAPRVCSVYIKPILDGSASAI